MKLLKYLSVQRPPQPNENKERIFFISLFIQLFYANIKKKIIIEKT